MDSRGGVLPAGSREGFTVCSLTLSGAEAAGGEAAGAGRGRRESRRRPRDQLCPGTGREWGAREREQTGHAACTLGHGHGRLTEPVLWVPAALSVSPAPVPLETNGRGAQRAGRRCQPGRQGTASTRGHVAVTDLPDQLVAQCRLCPRALGRGKRRRNKGASSGRISSSPSPFQGGTEISPKHVPGSAVCWVPSLPESAVLSPTEPEAIPWPPKQSHLFLFFFD